MELNHKKKDKKMNLKSSQKNDREWWPDLTAYRKAIFLHGTTFAAIDDR